MGNDNNSRRRSRETLFHLPGTDLNFTLEDSMEVIDPRTKKVYTRGTLRELMEKFA